jgi:hypothetical protein
MLSFKMAYAKAQGVCATLSIKFGKMVSETQTMLQLHLIMECSHATTFQWFSRFKNI